MRFHLALTVVVCTALGCPRPGLSQHLEMVEMADGVRLATDVYSPTGEGPWPVILQRTPYGRRGHSLSATALVFLMEGYAVVIQDMRGRFDSEGTDSVFFDDRTDGQETVEWILEQPWCDGRIGTVGPSALAIAQYLMAPGAPAELGCQIPMVGTPDMYGQGFYQGGVLRYEFIVEWLDDQGSSFFLADVLSHPDAGPYWQPVQSTHLYDQIDVSALHIGGWYDMFGQGTIDGFVGYRAGQGMSSSRRQFLIMGPWTHVFVSPAEGELTYPANAALDVSEASFDFMRWCIDGESGTPPIPAVQYYVMGDVDDEDAPGNEWRSANSWPPAADETRFFLLPGEILAPDGPPVTSAPFQFTADPADPVPTIGGANLNIPAGPHDQREIEERSDTLVFSTPVLAEPVEVTGHVRAVLWAATNAGDSDVAVRLTDVYPDGRSMLIVDGIQRLRYRDSYETAELPVQDEIVEVEVDLWSTSIVFAAGHRIRVVVSGSNFPRFATNLNTGGPPDAEGDGTIANLSLYTDAEHPSHVVLPILTEVPPVEPGIETVEGLDAGDGPEPEQDIAEDTLENDGADLTDTDVASSERVLETTEDDCSACAITTTKPQFVFALFALLALFALKRRHP